MRRRVFPGIMAALVLVSSQRATADTIQLPITAFADTATIVEFGVAISTPLPYFEDGANFLGYSGFSSSVIGGNAFLSLAGPGTLTVTFDQPVSMGGFNFSNSFSPAGVRTAVFSDLAGLQPVGQVIFPGFAPLQSGFVGWAADAPFARAEITFAVPSQFASFVIDDFRFDTGTPIPEPGTMVLALTGLGSPGTSHGGLGHAEALAAGTRHSAAGVCASLAHPRGRHGSRRTSRGCYLSQASSPGARVPRT